MMALSSHDKVHLFRQDYEEVHWNRNRQNEDLPDSPGFPSECSDADVRLVLSCVVVAFGVLACEVSAPADCLADSPLAPTQDVLLDGPWSMPPVPGTLW